MNGVIFFAAGKLIIINKIKMMDFDDLAQLFSQNAVYLPPDHPPKKSPVSKSQAYRFKLLKIWEASYQAKTSFEAFYNERMDELLAAADKELLEITGPKNDFSQEI